MTHSINQFWKEFDDAEITHSIAHYLLTIHALLGEKGYARAVDISHALDITAGSCSIGLKNLQKKGYIQEDNNKFISLTKQGKNIVNSLIEKRRVLQQFFQEILKVDGDRALVNACKIEHLLDSEIIKRIHSLL